MSDDFRRIEPTTGEARRLHWSTEQELQIIEESFLPGETVSSVARRRSVAPNLHYRWHRLLTEGEAAAVGSDESVVRSSEVRRLEERARSRKAAWPQDDGGRDPQVVAGKAGAKKTELAAHFAAKRRLTMKAVAEAIRVARSHRHDKVRRSPKPRSPYRRTDDDALVQLVRRPVDERPTYGYRHITALVNRDLARAGEQSVNHKRVFSIKRQNNMLLVNHGDRRTGRVNDGKVIVMRSNLRWCFDGFEILCWNGDLIRIAFIIDAHGCEIIEWHAVVGPGISGGMVRDIMQEAVESRFGALQAPAPLEWLTDNGSAYTAKETRGFATALNLIACFTPVQSPESNGISESFD